MNHHRRCISSLPTSFVHHKTTSIHRTSKIKPLSYTHIAKPSTISLPTASTSTSTNIIIDELNPSQREATLRPRYSITRVIAGPGAGSKYLLCFFFLSLGYIKPLLLYPMYLTFYIFVTSLFKETKVLTCRIAHLLLNHHQPINSSSSSGFDYNNNNREGILAVTFTKKAAMEMERRLSDLLSSAIQHEQQQNEEQQHEQMNEVPSSIGIATSHDDFIEEYEVNVQQGEFVQYGNAPLDINSNGETDEESNVDRLSRQYMRQTTVGTFHSVCSKILRKFGKELGNLPSVRSSLGITNASGASVAQEGIQTAASENDEGTSNNILIETLDGSYNILDQSDQLRLLKEVLEKNNIQLKSPSPSSGGNRNNDIRPITVLNAISLLNTRDATEGTTPLSGGRSNNDDDDISSKMSRKVYKIATTVQKPFQKAKYFQNAVDFDDLILLTRELLLNHPNIREVLHRQWRHILVDEFQDTSNIQLDLVRLLTTNSLFVVGDGDQSIYSWRGASPESMSDFELAFHGRKTGWEGLLPTSDNGNLIKYLENITEEKCSENSLEVKSVYLMENYRSTTNIVKAAQRIISTSDKKSIKDDNNTQENIRRDMKPMRGTGPSPRVLACKDAKAEAKFVVKTINSMVESGDISPSSTVAMIYRTNAQSRLLEEACVEQNLRYVVRGSSGTFYKRAEIQDCMSFLKIMYNARDRSAWSRAVKAPSRGIGPTSLNEFFRYCDVVTEKYAETASSRDELPTPLDVMISIGSANDSMGMLVSPIEILSTRSMNRFIPFASSLSSLKKKAEALPVSDFLLAVIDDLALKSHFDSISKTRDEYEDRLNNVMELVRAAERYKEDGPCISQVSEDGLQESPLGNFLDDVALIADLTPDESDSEGDARGRVVANLMTIHSAKGLEFDAVFLVGNEEGTFPTQRAISEGEGSIELSEERRLCYVAMTRAKTHLMLTWRREVSYFAGAAFKTRDGDRSRFLDALVSKPSQGGRTKNISSRKTTSKRAKNIGSTTKRELHTEANRYLNNNQRELHTVSNNRPSNKSTWGEWEPSTHKRTIQQTPSIRSMHNNAIEDMHKIRPASSQQRNQPLKKNSDRRQVMPSIRSQERLNDNRVSSRPPSNRVNRTQKMPNQILTKRTSSPIEDLRSDAPPDNMDSTIFFPIDSRVKHKLHGDGVVLTPPKGDAEFIDKMLVRVQFENNMEWDLTMDVLAHRYL